MVNDLIKIIGDKCEIGQFPPDFVQTLNHKMSFEEALDKTDQYIAKRNLVIPSKMNLADEKKHI